MILTMTLENKKFHKIILKMSTKLNKIIIFSNKVVQIKINSNFFNSVIENLPLIFRMIMVIFL